jgi:hypothetical protein
METSTDIRAQVAMMEKQLETLKRKLAQQNAANNGGDTGRSSSSSTCPSVIHFSNGVEIPEDKLVAMLTLEAEMRKSPHIQEKYAIVESKEEDESWMEVTIELQEKVARDFHFGEAGQVSISGAVAQLRASAHRHPEIAFWVKYNRAVRGNLRRNDFIPDMDLVLLSNNNSSASSTTARLHELVPNDGKPLGVIALSYS